MAVGALGWTVAASAAEVAREIFVASSDAGLSPDEVSKIASGVLGVSGVALGYSERMVVERGEYELDVLVIADERNDTRAETSGGIVWPLAQGTAITDEDDANRARVSVIGGPVRDGLFPGGSDPVGKELLVDGRPFIVKGVLAPHPPFEGGGPPDEARAKRMLATRVYVPFRTGVATIFGGKPISTARVSVDRPERLDEVVSAIRRLLAPRHGDNLLLGIVPAPP